MRLVDFSTLPEALDRAAESDSGLQIYSGRGRLKEALSYRELRDEAIVLARRMLGLGLVRHDRIALVAETGADFVRAFFACQYAGLIPVPLPLPLPFGERSAYTESIRTMLAKAGAKAVFAPSAYLAMIREAARSLALTALGAFSEMAALPERNTDLPPIDVDDPSYIQFSSGSTRTPRGVAVTQRALLANVRAIITDALRLRPGDRSMSWLPFYHDMGLVGFLLAPIAGRVSVDYVPTREFAVRPLVWPTLMSRNGCTISYSPSFGYALCARRAANVSLDGIDLTRWRIAGIGGEMIRPDALRQFTDVFGACGFRSEAFVASYGMAEATLGVTFAPLDRGIEVDTIDLDLMERTDRAAPVKANGHGHHLRTFVVCGRPLPNVALEIRGPDGLAAKDREVGRIVIRGPSVVRGYFADRKETAETVSDDGWLDTGDTGYLIDGSLVVTGRTKDLIVVNGRNVWPQDIEWAIERQIDGVGEGDVAAFSVDDGDEERVVVLIEYRKSDAVSPSALVRAAAAVVLAFVGIRCTVVPVPHNSLPKTSSGKLARSRARRMYLDAAFDDDAFVSAPAPLDAEGSALR